MSDYMWMPLDTPAHAGWWAFEGHLHWAPNNMLRAVVYVNKLAGGELSPAIMVWDENHNIVEDRYRYPSVFVGKWWPIQLPWLQPSNDIEVESSALYKGAAPQPQQRDSTTYGKGDPISRIWDTPEEDEAWKYLEDLPPEE